MKIASTATEAQTLEEKYLGQASGWIQWKGTDVCMDFTCSCGHHGHIDNDFVYIIQCSACGNNYWCNGHIELIQILEDENCPKVRI